jgi:hypothetical protein
MPLIADSDDRSLPTRGFARMFGLHPAVAFLIFIVDSMMFAADWGTLGAFWPVSVVVGLVLGIITYRAQIKWQGDDKESAFIKAAILALLTAIPAPIPALLSVPAGIVGIFNRKNT